MCIRDRSTWGNLAISKYLNKENTGGLRMADVVREKIHESENESESLSISYQICPEGFDKDAIDPEMINNRLSREEINEILTKVDNSQNGAGTKTLIIILKAILLLPLIACLCVVIQKKIGTGLMLFVLISLSLFWMIWILGAVMKLSDSYVQKMEKVLEEENETRLHSRRLKLTRGPNSLSLILHLDYTSPAQEMHFHNQATEMTNNSNLDGPLFP
eukprot:TRINITY_DN6599_c0_g3_i2.p1 TRINITY_DN6599_c0_g3~~TRINITY_DN6599_c0_g3_i2.p1  ORF type:complete len:217 (-),score=32.35 TRINITY_DN6599_c0_g3_i2:3-653(-)